MIDILTTLGISGIVMTGFVWFLKLFIDKFFAMQTKKIEQEHQIIFSNLHEKRAIIIAELYDKIVKIEDSLRISAFETLLGNEGKIEASINKTKNTFLEFRNFFKGKKIYFSEEQCTLISDLIDKQGEIWIDMTMEDESLDELAKYQDINKRINSNLKIVKTQIEQEFRKLLGVK